MLPKLKGLIIRMMKMDSEIIDIIIIDGRGYYLQIATGNPYKIGEEIILRSA